MEKNKIVFIAAVALITLLGFVGLGIWQFYPGKENARKVPLSTVSPMPGTTNLAQVPASNTPTTPGGTTATEPGVGTNPAGTANGTETSTTPVINNSNDVLVIYGGNAVVSDNPNRIITVGPQLPSGTNAQGQVSGSNPQVGTTPNPSTQALSTVAPPSSGTPQVNTTVVVQNQQATAVPTPPPATPRAQTPSTSSAESRPRVAANTNPAPSSRPSQATIRGKELWIQVLSSPNRDRVETLKDELVTRGWSGRITTKNINGTDYYRLRYGPFPSAPEAEKFLGFVRAVKGLEASYVVEEYPAVASN